MQKTNEKLRIPETLRKVKNLIGIFSAKGGVGKSAISLQVALALRDKGYKVGLVDADIYGPSQPVMLNAHPGELKLTNEKIIEPLEKEGIKFISMGLISDEKINCSLYVDRKRGRRPKASLATKIFLPEKNFLKYLIF